MSTKNVKDVKMYYIEDDIKKIQVKTNLYIQQFGPEGAFHLAREVIQNSIDEDIDPESPGNKIDIKYDETLDCLTVEDNGRGFPEADYPMDIFCTKIQSGSKFFREQSGDTSGEFGLGLTAVNALSKEFSITSYREREKYIHKIEFENGNKISDTKTALPKKGKQHGSIIRFIPSVKYLGKNTKLPFDDMLNWIERMNYLIPEGITTHVELYKGMKLKSEYDFKAKPFVNLLNSILGDNVQGKLNFTLEKMIEDETISGVKSKRKIKLEVAMAYDDSDTYYDSYCNYTNTIDGGVHVDAVESAICTFLINKAKATMTDKQKEKYPLLWADVKGGLKLLINLSTNAQVQFVGNQKTKIGNKKLAAPIRELVNEGLTKEFEKNASKLDAIIKVIKLNARARVAALEEKNATQKERMDSFKEYQIPNYVRCNNTGKQYKEIFLVEGERSAAGCVINGRDPKTQAIFGFRGNTANAYKWSLTKIMENKEWRNFVKVLRCGIGPTFDMNKLYFNRINLFTDADIDGYNISSGMLAFIYKYYPEFIKAGIVYKVFPPLYQLENKDNPKQKLFASNKAELSEIYRNNIADKYKIGLADEKDFMNKSDLSDFLLDVIDYRTELIRIKDHFGEVNKFLVELLIALLVESKILDDFGKHEYPSDEYLHDMIGKRKFITYLMSNIQKKFKEITLTDYTLSGVIDGEFQAIDVSRRFVSKCEKLIPIYQKYGHLLKVKKKGDKEVRIMSIGEFLDESYYYFPKIMSRFKGLGELDDDDMSETTLKEENRISVQYTMEDAARETEVLKMLHAQGDRYLKGRKKMMSEYKIDREDLDN